MIKRRRRSSHSVLRVTYLQQAHDDGEGGVTDDVESHRDESRSQIVTVRLHKVSSQQQLRYPRHEEDKAVEEEALPVVPAVAVLRLARLEGVEGELQERH